MPQFWSKLANLQDTRWGVEIGNDESIGLSKPEYHAEKVSPVCAVATQIGEKLFLDPDRARKFIGLNRSEANRVDEAAVNRHTKHQRTRHKINRALQLF